MQHIETEKERRVRVRYVIYERTSEGHLIEPKNYGELVFNDWGYGTLEDALDALINVNNLYTGYVILTEYSVTD